MPTPIIFTITTAGRVAALDAFDNGLTIALTHCAFGSGKYTPTGSETALNTELGRVGLSGGAIESVSATLRFSAALAASTHINAFEIGLFSSTGVLFAVASTTSTTIPLTVVEPNIETICAFGLVLGDVPTSSLTIAIDPSAPLAIQLINQHVAAANPHPQYKRRLDNTEQMKVAAAVDGDDAIRKDTLDALRVRLVANGIDANLGVTNHLPNINIDPFLIPEGYFDGSTLGDKPFPYGICRTRKEDNGVVYQFAQSSANGDFATRMYRESVGHWTDWKYYASLNGNSTEFFSVKTATSDNHAPTYKQLVDGLNAVSSSIPSISGKADLAGNAAQQFAVANATAGSSAVNKTQAEALATGAVVSAMPTGAMIMWPTATAPSGFVEAAGQSTAPYPSLTPIYGSNLPDMRGEFVRGFDNGRGVDSGRAIRSFQADEIKAHTHDYFLWSPGGEGYSDGMSNDGTVDNRPAAPTTSTGGSETRPRNVAMMYIIKI